MPDRPRDHKSCSRCRLFVDDPHQLEKAFPGILALSSSYGSARGDSGICLFRDTFQVPEIGCQHFEARPSCFRAVADNVTPG